MRIKPINRLRYLLYCVASFLVLFLLTLPLPINTVTTAVSAILLCVCKQYLTMCRVRDLGYSLWISPIWVFPVLGTFFELILLLKRGIQQPPRE